MKNTIKKLGSLLGYKITRNDNESYFSFDSLLNYYLFRYDSITFVQIGGCDGISFDPLYPVIKRRPQDFKGIIIEPIEDYHHELSKVYKNNPQIKTLRCAIHNSLDEAVLYRPDPAIFHKLPDFAKGVVSFDKTQVDKLNLLPDEIIEERVPCKTLSEVVSDHDIENLDLLLIDTEGYDAEILLNNDFEEIRPSIIHFEHGLRENMISKEQLERLFEMLHFYQYELIFEDFDAIAIHRDLLLSITE